MATETISQDLADLLASKNFDPKYKDKSGNDCSADEAVTFAFDWTGPSGKNYGTAVIILNDNDLALFFGDNLGRSIEIPEDKEAWFQFFEQMSDFSTQHRYTWSPKDLSQLKHTLAGIAAIKEGLFEGYYGTRKISYMGEQTSARLVIKHNRMLGENDKRYRYVESLYIETGEGERFKLPFVKLAGGRAMLEHVRQGGKPYDIRGCHIAEMVTEMNVLARFNRASQHRVFEGNTQDLVESAQNYYHSLQESLKRLSSSRGYRDYFESWNPADVSSEESLVEDIKTLFVEQTIDSRIESALPLLAKIQKQGSAMKELQMFESWVNNITEGTWALPDTPEQQARLLELMSRELIAGPDGTNATEQLYDLVGDDELFDLIAAAAASNPDANIWDNSRIVERLSELGVDVSAITDAAAEQPLAPPQEVEPAVEPAPVAAEQPPVPPVPVAESLNESAYYDGYTDGFNGKEDPNARSRYAHQIDDYYRGFKEGKKKAERDQAERTEKYQSGMAPFKDVPTPKLKQELKAAQDRTNEIRAIYDRLRGSSYSFDPKFHTPPNDQELEAEFKALTDKIRGIQNVLDNRHSGFKESTMVNENMSEVDAIIQDIIAGKIDPYQIMTRPGSPEEEYVSRIIEKEYEDVAIQHRLHPDDDFEQILDRVVDRLADDYGRHMDEADTVHSFGETSTVSGSMAPVMDGAHDDPMNYNAAITSSFYESELDRIKKLALAK